MEEPLGGARVASGDESESGHHVQQAAQEPPHDDTANSSRAAGSARSIDLEEAANSEENIVPSIACQLLPHGLYAFLPASIALMAWLATLSQDDCDFAKVTGDVVAELTGSSGAIAKSNSFSSCFRFFGSRSSQLQKCLSSNLDLIIGESRSTTTRQMSGP